MLTIEQEKCIACGICGHVCPRHIPETMDRNGGKVTAISSERRHLCMECGHCEAVCPEGAIRVASLEKEGFASVDKLKINAHQLLDFIKQRRSVRRYKDKPVPRDLIDRIIEGVHLAPTGTARRTTGVIVIDNPEKLEILSKHFFSLYEKLDAGLKHPIARFFIKRRVGNRLLGTLEDFVMPGMRWYIRWYREGKSNEILRDCPALMLFHSPKSEPMGAENCLIAAFHAILMAQVLGIGTCLNDLIPPVCNRSSEIRSLLQLKEHREIYASITLGFPKYDFKRTIPRKLAEVSYL